MTEPQLEFDFAPAQDTPRTPPPAPKAAIAPRETGRTPITSLTDAQRLHEELERRSGMVIHLRITNNRSTVMAVKFSHCGLSARLSLHHMFVQAGPDVVLALAHWVKHPRSRKHAALLNGYIRDHNHLIAPRKARTVPLHTQGRVYDLQKLYDEVNAAEFEGRVDAPITWGKMPPLKRRRSIRFGSYSPQEHLIRMHPLLDDPAIPAFFIRYIVFHEMLHADLGIEETEGRRVLHSRAFRLRERQYKDFAAAERWMENPKNLALVLGRARRREGA